MSARTARRAAPKQRRSWGYYAGNIIALAVTTAVALGTLWPVYQSVEFLRLGAVAFTAGALIALLGALYRWASWILVLITVGTYLLVGVPLAIPGKTLGGVLPSADGMLELLAATALSWKQLLTVVLPVGAYQSLLVPALVLVLLSTVIGLSTALRARHPELGVLPPVALFLAGIALGPPSATSPMELGLALFVSVLFWLLWLRWERRRTALRLVAQQSRATIESAGDRRLAAARGLLSSAVVIAVAIAVGATAALAAPPPEERDVLRSHVEQPFDPRAYPSPLTGFRGYLQPELAGTVLLSVTGLPDGGRIRLAALDTYDGIVYSAGSDTVSSASGSFTRLPYRLDQSSVVGDDVSLTVRVEGYRDIWVPGVGKLERIQFTGQRSTANADAFYYNDNSGTGAVLGGLSAGDSFRVDSVVPRDVDDLASLSPGSAALPPVGVVPDELAQVLESWVRPGDPPGVQLASMIDGLRANGYVSHGIGPDEPASRSGHGADRLAQLFTQRPMLGDEEQYSVAAALMARRLGFPARVVVGFVPGEPDATGVIEVTGSDIASWVEVQASGGEWVTIDPTPPVRSVPDRQPDEPTVVSRPQTVVPPVPEDTTQQRDLTPPESTEEDPLPAPNPLFAFLLEALRIAGWAVLGLAIVLGPFLTVIVAKLQRRRRRRSAPTPEDRIRGGWQEFADTAVDFGIDPPRSATRTELAETVGGTQSLVLAAVVDKATFGPGESTTSDAAEVWEAVGALRMSLARATTRRQRLRALISLRSFGRYAGRTTRVIPGNRRIRATRPAKGGAG
ncbi:MAG TPA: transglutaminase-like domain-containing protein [Glaciibacter sp.]|nr:transglutaminase-like domain-containing protein [Glaciibacter sp.]